MHKAHELDTHSIHQSYSKYVTTKHPTCGIKTQKSSIINTYKTQKRPAKKQEMEPRQNNSNLITTQIRHINS